MGKLTIPTPNKDIVVSWIYSWARQREMSIHEYRVVLRAMEIISAQMSGKKMEDYKYKVTPTPATYEITMSIKDAFFRNMKPADVKAELENLVQRTFSVNNRKERIWWCCSFIEHPEVHFGEGTFSFGIYKPFAEVLLNFTEGYREFELNKALALPTTYAMRFYILMSGGGEGLYKSIEEFKEWAGIDPNDYVDKNGKHRVDNLENRVIKPAQKALNETCPWTFTYEKVRETKHPKSKVIGFRFYPKEQKTLRDIELSELSLVSAMTRRSAMGEDILNILQYGCKWPKASLDKNKQNIAIAKRVLGKDKTTAVIADRIQRWRELNRESPSVYKDQIAWVMGALINTVKEIEPTAFDKTTHQPKSLFEDEIPY